MYNPFAVALLAIEAQKVVELRLVKLAWGGAEAQLEAQQMRTARRMYAEQR
ncbi:hypothetical protein [Methylobacterium fujisawaense]